MGDESIPLDYSGHWFSHRVFIYSLGCIIAFIGRRDWLSAAKT
jgi:hypothetical protein